MLLITGVNCKQRDTRPEQYQTSDCWPVLAENGDEVKSQNEPGENWAEELYDNWR